MRVVTRRLMTYRLLVDGRSFFIYPKSQFLQEELSITYFNWRDYHAKCEQKDYNI
jgi:hypothetical protein